MSVIVEYISTNYIWILLVLIIILLAIIGWYADKTNFGQGKKNLMPPEDHNFDIEAFNEAMKDKKMLDQLGNGVKQNNNIISNNIENQVINSQPITNVNSDPNLNFTNGVIQPTQPITNSNAVIYREPVNSVVSSGEINSIIPNIQVNSDPIVNNVETGIVLSPVENNNIGAVQYDSDDVYSVQRELNKIDNVDIDKTTMENEQAIEVLPQKEQIEINSDNFEEKFKDIIPEKDIMDENLLEDIDNLTLEKTQKLDLSELPSLDDVDLPRIKQLKTNDEGIWKF